MEERAEGKGGGVGDWEELNGDRLDRALSNVVVVNK